MTCSELRDPLITRVIARKLANVHSLNVPINKEPVWLFETMNNWLQVIRSTVDIEQVKSEHQEYANNLLNFNFENEIAWLKDFLTEVRSPVVFSHNDLQEGNILLPDGNINNRLNNNNGTKHLKECDQNSRLAKPNNEKPLNDLSKSEATKLRELDERIVLIDFEYCSYNFRAFDLSNHFCEWALDYSNTEYPHFTINEELYPNEKEKRIFIREYLQWSKALDLNDPINSEDHLLIESNRFILASHLLWSLWSVMNAFTSPIEFGYWVSNG